MKVAKFLAILLLLVASWLLLCACGGPLSDAAKLKELDFGSDKVPTINAVLGQERKVTAVDVGTNNGAPFKQYTYSSTSVTQDLSVFAKHLRDKGWVVVKDYNFEKIPGMASLAIESSESGKILYMSIAYEKDKYAIKVTKAKGTLTRD